MTAISRPAVLWHVAQAFRRMLLRGHKGGALERREQLRRHFANPWTAVMWLRYYKGPPTECALELRDGRGPLHVRAATTDRGVIWEVFVEDAYRLDALAPGALGCVVDVGAHAGFFARRAAGLARRVIAFEPVRANFELLRKNADPARNPGVSLHNKAVAGRPGTLRLQLSSSTAGHSAFHSPIDPAGGAFEEVEAVALPDALAAEGVERVDLLKVDCEGGEYEILDSLAATGWLERTGRIALEYHEDRAPAPDRTGAAIERRLAAAGFTVERIQSDAHAGMIFAAR